MSSTHMTESDVQGRVITILERAFKAADPERVLLWFANVAEAEGDGETMAHLLRVLRDRDLYRVLETMLCTRDGKAVLTQLDIALAKSKAIATELQSLHCALAWGAL